MAEKRALLSSGALVVAGLGALAIAIHKGWIKIPNILGLLPGDVGRGAQEVPGIPGAIGGATYNIFTPGGTTLKERVTERYMQVAQEEGITEEAAFAKVTAEEASTDVHTGAFGTGFWGNLFPPFAGYTIGTGLGAISQWGKYLENLPPAEKAAARQTEYEKRAQWMWEHPVESTIGFPAQIIHEGTKPPGAPSAPMFTGPDIVIAARPTLDKLLPFLIPGQLGAGLIGLATRQAKTEPPMATGVFYDIGTGEPVAQEPTPIRRVLPEAIKERIKSVAETIRSRQEG